MKFSCIRKLCNAFGFQAARCTVYTRARSTEESIATGWNKCFNSIIIKAYISHGKKRRLTQYYTHSKSSSKIKVIVTLLIQILQYFILCIKLWLNWFQSKYLYFFFDSFFSTFNGIGILVCFYWRFIRCAKCQRFTLTLLLSQSSCNSCLHHLESTEIYVYFHFSLKYMFYYCV